MTFPINTNHLTQQAYDELLTKHLTKLVKKAEANNFAGDTAENVFERVKNKLDKLTA